MSNKLNICFFSGDITNSGGTERVAIIIANELNKNEKYNISVLSLVEKKKNTFFQLDEGIARYTVYDHVVRGITHIGGIINRTRKFMKKNNIDIMIDIDGILEMYTIPAKMFTKTKPDDEVELKKSKPDFIGVNYYFSICVEEKKGTVNYQQPPFWISDDFNICENDYLKKTEWMDKGIDPVGLHIGMQKIYHRYRLPMIVTENGMAYSDKVEKDGTIHDEYRIDYLKKHIEQLKIMIDEGIPVLGYCPWSFIDVVSSHQGFQKRYGLVYVDRTETDPKQCARIKKDSFYWYKEVIRNNGLTKESIRGKQNG